MKTEKRIRAFFATLLVLVGIPIVAAAQTVSFKPLGIIHSSNPKNCTYTISADGSMVLARISHHPN